MSFHVGQKIVCVNVIPEPGALNTLPVQVGGEYTVRQIVMCGGQECIRIAESYRVHATLPDCPMFAWRFRPAVELSTETGMAIVRKAADDARKYLVVKA